MCTPNDLPIRPAHESRDDAEATEAFLGYLDEHPHAMDTVEGIAEWWLMRQQIRVHVTTLMRVLHRLTERGLVDEIGTGEQRRYFRRRPTTRGGSEGAPRDR
jgi:Fe2+ or Zn2+ uptake regulation protein